MSTDLRARWLYVEVNRLLGRGSAKLFFDRGSGRWSVHQSGFTRSWSWLEWHSFLVVVCERNHVSIKGFLD